MVHITVMSCCSNSCCQTSVKLLATFAFQCTTRAQREHWAAATQDSGLHTGQVASQQTRPQSCKLQDIYSHPEMRLSKTAWAVKHRRWAVVSNRVTYYISQGRVETRIRCRWAILLQFCCKFIPVLVRQNIWKYVAVWQSYCKNKKVHFWPHSEVLHRHIFYIFRIMSRCMILVAGLTAGPIGTKLCTRIPLDPGSVLDKSNSRSRAERRRRKNWGAICADSLCPEDGYYS